jgi:ABC-2 type transport system ATP-binding protein
MANAVVLTGVTKSFHRTIAVDNLDLAVPEGSIYGFIGPNGSGKTTTLRLMLRIFQPDAGHVSILGADHGNVADERVGYLPEERGLYKRMKVLRVIEYFARLKGFYDCRRAANEWLDRLGALSWAHYRIDSLSKGMAQKVQFIIAVIARPRLLILDEPFAGLDPVNLDLLQSAVLSLREQGTTVVFSTHDMNIAEKMCDTILMIFQGKKVLDGTLAAIRQNYPVNQLRVRMAHGSPLPANLSASSLGGYNLIRLENGQTPQSVLRQLVELGPVDHFEVVRPTLHDIFVEIARPQDHERATA